MKLRADLHIHTHYSYDSSLPPEDIVRRSRELGLDVIGVVDHNTCRGAIDTKKAAKGNPLVLVGQETETQEGEILVFGASKDLKKGRPLKETCVEAKKLGGLVIAPHPFDTFRSGVGKSIKGVLEQIDAIESMNPMCAFGAFNTKAERFASRNGKPMVAGSDAHFIKEIGKCLTIIECDKSEKSLIDAIRKGKTEIIGERGGFVRRVGSRIRQKLKQ